MGITFRSGDYVKFVKFGHRTIKDGEAAAIWNVQGELTEVVGPRRVTLWFSTIRFLSQIQATRGQYLRVEYRDGSTDHVVGPFAMYLNPAKHKEIKVMDGHHLATEDDCLVMYGSSSSSEKGLSANRRIVYGPQFVIPSEQESVHAFNWSPKRENPSGPEVGCANRFHVLPTNKISQWKMNLALKTKEGVVAHVSLAMSYKIENAEKCLEIADPIAYVQAAILCDANRGDISLSGISSAAGQASTFHSFGEAMSAVGFRVLKLHLLDISLPSSVAEKRQKEKEEREHQSKVTSEMKKDLELSRLAFEKKRVQAEEQAALDKAQGQLDTELAEQARAAQTAAVHNELLLHKMRKEAQNDGMKLAYETRLEYLRGLQEIGVDVTKVLVAQAYAQQPKLATISPAAQIGPEATASADHKSTETPAVDNWGGEWP